MPAINQSSEKPTALIALADGQLFYGRGFGATGTTVAELVFNTAMTGYQEIMTDPSYAGQVVTFTFPHVGNVGTNSEDEGTGVPVVGGLVVKWGPTRPRRSDGLAGQARPDRRRRRRYPPADARHPPAGRPPCRHRP